MSKYNSQRRFEKRSNLVVRYAAGAIMGIVVMISLFDRCSSDEGNQPPVKAEQAELFLNGSILYDGGTDVADRFFDKDVISVIGQVPEGNKITLDLRSGACTVHKRGIDMSERLVSEMHVSRNPICAEAFEALGR
ncbi:MAG: hypothetical protein AAF413_03720 [Patescibacteria group bacterium]